MCIEFCPINLFLLLMKVLTICRSSGGKTEVASIEITIVIVSSNQTSTYTFISDLIG